MDLYCNFKLSNFLVFYHAVKGDFKVDSALGIR